MNTNRQPSILLTVLLALALLPAAMARPAAAQQDTPEPTPSPEPLPSAYIISFSCDGLVVDLPDYPDDEDLSATTGWAYVRLPDGTYTIQTLAWDSYYDADGMHPYSRWIGSAPVPRGEYTVINARVGRWYNAENVPFSVELPGCGTDRLYLPLLID